ncbi:hypothetical protein C8Q80DRAFT_1187788 [Daedaleopsis nitida]|nr:hypothetical protein C8Q80DRAFT_1187788 [Daedaleopsis nitida]
MHQPPLAFARSFFHRGDVDTALSLAINVLRNGRHLANAAIPGLGLAVDVLIKILQTIQGARYNKHQSAAILKEVTVLHESLTSVSEGIKIPAEVMSRVQVLKSTLDRVLEDLNNLNVHRARFIDWLRHNGDDGRELESIQSRIKSALYAFTMEMNLVLAGQLNEVKIALNEKMDRDILDELLPAKTAAWSAYATGTKSRLLDGTRIKVMETLDAWMEFDRPLSADIVSSSGITLLTGVAGSGKSTIALKVCERLRNDHLLGASFFFSGGLRTLQSVDTFFPTIAYQLAESQPSLRRHIIEAARSYASEGPIQPLENTFHALIEKPLAALRTECPDHRPIFVVLDALDECSSSHAIQQHLERLAIAHTGSSFRLRILITSRPDPNPRTDLKQPSPEYTISLDNLDRTSLDHDISMLITSELNRTPRGKEWCDSHQEVVPCLTKLSNGLFLYAQTAVEFLMCDDYHLDARLALLTQRSSPSYQPLNSLDGLYSTILKTAFPKERTAPYQQEHLRRVLQYLVVLQDQEGISPRMLEHLTGMPICDSVPVLNALRSVVYFNLDDPDSNFRLAHSTFHDFLIHLPSDSDYHMKQEISVTHLELAENCRAALEHFRTQHIPAQTDLDLIVFATSHWPPRNKPHVHYALDHLDDHISLSRSSSADHTSALEHVSVPVFSSTQRAVVKLWLDPKRDSIYDPWPLVNILKQTLHQHNQLNEWTSLKWRIIESRLDQLIAEVSKLLQMTVTYTHHDFKMFTEDVLNRFGARYDTTQAINNRGKPNSAHSTAFRERFEDCFGRNTRTLETLFDDASCNATALSDSVTANSTAFDLLTMFLDALYSTRAYVESINTALDVSHRIISRPSRGYLYILFV